jgi:crossover junction endodeoxyribonuclease RuvC
VRVLGVDPGATGAIAFLQITGGLPVDLECIDLPVLRLGRRTKLDEYALAREVDARLKADAEPFAAAIIEQGAVRPGNGRVGAAAFWLGLGAIRGIMAAHFIPIEIVTPHAWKASLRVTGDKDASRLRASAIFPRWAGQWSRVKDHGRAEAALIALHGANRLPVVGARKSA